MREKDGLWAVLFWMNLLAHAGRPLPDIVGAHWVRYGRHHYQRHDWHVPEAGRASALMDTLRAEVERMAGTLTPAGRITLADDFCYRDPVDGSVSEHQGIRLVFEGGSRIVYRLSGTGTAGATLRVYLERHVHAPADIGTDTGSLLRPLGELSADLARIREQTGLEAPDAVI